MATDYCNSVHTVFIPETPEMQSDINAILSTDGVEYVDIKPYVPAVGSKVFPYNCGGVWLLFRGRADIAMDVPDELYLGN